MFEKAIALLAPHHCLVCGETGFVLCRSCQLTQVQRPGSRCYRCHKATRQYQVCRSCRSTSPLHHVWVAAQYEGVSKRLVEALKFERAKAAAVDIAAMLDDVLPILPKETVISYIPTARSRVRVRGYDQSELIARHFARMRGLKSESVLCRISSNRQVGSGRKSRFEQAGNAYALRNPSLVDGKRFLIIDDVTTSGATIEAAARLLKSTGAKTVDVAVFAQAVE